MSTPDRPPRDAHGDSALRYAAALLDSSGRVPDEDVDWEAFHTRLAARAELSLARLRHPHVAQHVPDRSAVAIQRDANERPVKVAWWEPAARWSRLVVATSVAAGIVLIIVVRASPKDATDMMIASVATVTDQADGTRAAFESAAIGRAASWTIDSGVLPSAADLLIPLGKGGKSP